LGVLPKTVIDVGAASGTLALYETFPDARHILIEPLVEFKPQLEKLKKTVAHLDYVIAAASRQAGEIVLNVHRDLYGSSIYLETEESDVNGTARTVAAVSLDGLCESSPSPYLIKLDVQGGELDALAGAERTLSLTEYVVLETSLFQFYQGGPQFRDTLEFMHQRGFVLYDLLDPQYRPLDNALSQVDAVFVREGGALRRHHQYATVRQRAQSNQQFRKGLKHLNIEMK